MNTKWEMEFRDKEHEVAAVAKTKARKKATADNGVGALVNTEQRDAVLPGTKTPSQTKRPPRPKTPPATKRPPRPKTPPATKRPPRPKTPPQIDAVLLDALRGSEVSCYEIAKQQGVDKGVLSRFKAGNRPRLTLTQAEKIARGLGLQLVLVAGSGE